MFPIAFQLKHQPNLKLLDTINRYSSSPLRNIIDVQNRFFQSLLREPITISLRYFYNPSATSDDKCLQIFIIFNTELEDVSKPISSLKNSEFHEIYPFQPIEFNTIQSHTLQNLDWVNSLMEIHKAEIISDKGYYLPRPFSVNHEHNMVTVCEQLSRIRKNSQERFLLEITLQPYNNPAESSQWMNAIDTLLKVQSQAGNSGKDAIRETVIKGFQDYQTKYNYNPVFTYSIKLLAETENHLSNLAITWLQNATSSDYANYYQNLPTLKRGSSEFEQSLQATREIRISPRSSNHSTQLQQICNQNIRQVFGSKPLFGDGSTRHSQYVPPPTPPGSPVLPNSTTTPATSSSLALGSSHALAKPIATQGWNRPQPAHIKDFFPLRYLVTFDEFSSFLRVVVPDTQPIPGMTVVKPSFPKASAEEIFYSHQNLITHDKYIVGINKKGNIVTSNWNDAPHRLVAGVTRCGKTNFLHWLIFQFLYADPQRKIYILDLKRNNFRFYKTQLPKQISDRIIIATEILECSKVLETVYAEYQRRQEIIGDYQTIEEMVKNGGEYVPRLLVIVDEAAMIPPKCQEFKSTFASTEQQKNNLQAKIDTNLQYFATTGAGYSIHLMYCTQNPTQQVINNQVTSQLEERLIFRITNNTSMGIIGENLHKYGLKIAEGAEGKGIAYMDGVEGKQYVYTPLISVPPATPFNKTLWNLL